MFICPFHYKCGKKYKTKAALRIHLYNKHPPEATVGTQTLAGLNTRNWMCDECGATEEFLLDEPEPYARHECVLEIDENNAQGMCVLHND